VERRKRTAVLAGGEGARLRALTQLDVVSRHDERLYGADPEALSARRRLQSIAGFVAS
jgi:hypothetical protein